ncbi:hypothetical protein NL676_002811 [Syzygium grande]|nr:hypothetical protein NL676_002811 [Syzygium grande]
MSPREAERSTINPTSIPPPFPKCRRKEAQRRRNGLAKRRERIYRRQIPFIGLDPPQFQRCINWTSHLRSTNIPKSPNTPLTSSRYLTSSVACLLSPAFSITIILDFRKTAKKKNRKIHKIGERR